MSGEISVCRAYAVFDGFTRQQNIDRLVWFEQHESIESAIIQEKQMVHGNDVN